MLRIFFLFALCTGVLAERLTLVDLTDPQSNLLFSQLAQYHGTSQTQEEAIATATAANSILKQLAPSIVLLPGYTGLFTGNCSMFFNHQIENVACDINPASAHDLTAGAEIIPGTSLPGHYAHQIRNSHILLANIFADWTGRKKQEFETDLYFRTSSCSQTLSQEPLTTPSTLDTQTQTVSASASASLAATMTWLASVSASQPSKTLSPTLPILPTPTISASQMDTASVTPSHAATQTTSLSSTYSKTLSVLASATRSLTASLSPTRSASLSNTRTPTLSPTETIIPTPSQSLSATQTDGQTFVCNPPPTGLMAVWNASTGVYADATNQTNRYDIFNGTVTDTFTNIQWEQAASNITMDWASAASYCGNQTTGGFTGWRVPNIEELGTMVDYTVGSPNVNTGAFPGAPADSFWASTSVAGLAGNSWEIDLSTYGSLSYISTSSTNKIRCVRSCYPTAVLSPRYIAASGEVTDLATDLVWQQASPTSGGPNSDGTYIWSATMATNSAQAYCAGLALNGHTWRLPTIRELSTLLNYNITHNTLLADPIFTGATPLSSSYYWSATKLTTISNTWVIDFYDGYMGASGFSAINTHVRCIR